jgi:hypothetical protein
MRGSCVGSVGAWEMEEKVEVGDMVQWEKGLKNTE